MPIHFDQAATSHPKPDSVIRAVADALRRVAGSPGRGGHPGALAASRLLSDAREALAAALGHPASDHVVFASGATAALNGAIHGLMRPGDHAVHSAVEHNAVVRPLREWKARGGVNLSVLPADGQGRLDPDALRARLRPRTRLVAVSHASNVTGALQPIVELARVVHEHSDAFLLVDAAQSAGAIPLNFAALGADLLAVTGHKSLLGPPGVGALLVRPGVPLRPVFQGGTGTRSDRTRQPEDWPEGYEPGTPNTPGLAGLGAALAWLRTIGIEAIRAHEASLIRRMWEGLGGIEGVIRYGPHRPEERLNLISFNLAGRDPSEAALALEEGDGLWLRAGLHCAPLAHRAVGSHPSGSIRASVGYFNTPEEVDILLEAVRRLARS